MAISRRSSRQVEASRALPFLRVITFGQAAGGLPTMTQAWALAWIFSLIHPCIHLSSVQRICKLFGTVYSKYFSWEKVFQLQRIWKQEEMAASPIPRAISRSNLRDFPLSAARRMVAFLRALFLKITCHFRHKWGPFPVLLLEVKQRRHQETRPRKLRLPFPRDSRRLVGRSVMSVLTIMMDLGCPCWFLARLHLLCTKISWLFRLN